MRILAFVGAVFVIAVAFVLGMEYEGASSQGAAVVNAVEATSTTPRISEENSQQQYRVVKVVDGDTIALEIDGKSTTVRLIGLDTPETVDPRKLVQCFGVEASNKAKEMLSGKTVSIETDNTQGDLDKYGRLLVYLYLPNGTLFNKYMIAEGYGHEYTYNIPYAYQAEFKEAERNARAEKKGLWADGACTAAPTAPPSTTRANTKAPETTLQPGEYDCSYNAYNCSSFKMQAEAEAAFEACGGSTNDVHKLDSDKDGRVCESLP